MFICSQLQLSVTANIVPSLLIHSTLMTEAVCSSETSVLTRAMQHHISEDSILHSLCHENLKSYLSFLLLSKVWENIKTEYNGRIDLLYAPVVFLESALGIHLEYVNSTGLSQYQGIY
jgi:hypothetical protein